MHNMVKLKDVVAKAGSTGTGIASLTSTISKSTALVTKIATGITLSGAFNNRSNKDIVKFSEQAEKIVTQDSFLDELDSKIGPTRQNETEDEFVARAKKEMRELLRLKLK